MRMIIALVVAAMLSGCTAVNDVFTVDTIPDTQTGASKTANYPEINDVPVGETSQLSDAQTAAEKRALNQAASKGRGQAGANNQASYRQEVARLRRLAQEQRQRGAKALKAASQ